VKITPFTTLDQIEAAVSASLAKIDYAAIVERTIASALDRARGRV
jgi:hypothetical protein